MDQVKREHIKRKDISFMTKLQIIVSLFSEEGFKCSSILVQEGRKEETQMASNYMKR